MTSRRDPRTIAELDGEERTDLPDPGDVSDEWTRRPRMTDTEADAIAEEEEAMSKTEHLKSGDPYTFIQPIDRPLLSDRKTPLAAGDHFSWWFATNESGKVFRVVRITTVGDSIAYECKFVGSLSIEEDDEGRHTIRVIDTDGKEVKP